MAKEVIVREGKRFQHTCPRCGGIHFSKWSVENMCNPCLRKQFQGMVQVHHPRLAEMSR